MKRTRAFTLIELLVVVAIIALLMSILIPALAGARAQALSTSCKSLMRGYGIAFITYAAENDQWHVDAYKFLDYSAGLPKYMGNKSLEKVARCPGDGLTYSLNRTGPLGLNTNVTVIGGKPYDYLIKDASDTVITPTVSIGANENALSSTHRMTSVGESTFWVKRSMLENENEQYNKTVIDPTKIMLFGDWQNNIRASASASTPDPAALKGAIIQTSNIAGVIGSVAFRHRGACNAVFLDGHASEIRTTLPLTAEGHDFVGTATWGSVGSGQQFKLYYPFGPGMAPFGYTIYGDMPGIVIK